MISFAFFCYSFPLFSEEWNREKRKKVVCLVIDCHPKSVTTLHLTGWHSLILAYTLEPEVRIPIQRVPIIIGIIIIVIILAGDVIPHWKEHAPITESQHRSTFEAIETESRRPITSHLIESSKTPNPKEQEKNGFSLALALASSSKQDEKGNERKRRWKDSKPTKTAGDYGIAMEIKIGWIHGESWEF